MSKALTGFVITFITSLLSPDPLTPTSNERPVVRTAYGSYRGEMIKSLDGGDIYAFRGVPYAQPPVGKLRFKGPVQLEKREGIFDATESSLCIQSGLGFLFGVKTAEPVGAEDCLYLDVYVPKTNSDKLLPVFMWIHGGGFLQGTGAFNITHPGIILNKNRDMVMVSINYRLGIFGFLSLDDEVIPGNLGLKDQVMALKWIQENIESFGGDPNLVTIVGQSAGGASVSLLLHSRPARGLFHRAISHSGTHDCSWALRPKQQARESSAGILFILGCPSEPSKALDCLQQPSAKTLLKSLEMLQYQQGVPELPFLMIMAPVIENESPDAFVTRASLKEASSIPWITGVTSEEGLVFYQVNFFRDARFGDLSILKTDGKRLFPEISYYKYHPNKDEITRKLLKFYLKDKYNIYTVKNFVKLMSDTMFYHGLHLTSQHHKGKQFKYKLSYQGKLSFGLYRPIGTENVTTHADDLFYFFPKFFFLPTIKQDKRDEEISNTLMDMWYNFVLTGDPTPESHIWEESEGGRKYLDITDNGLIMSTDMFQDRMKFLDTLQLRDYILDS